MDTRKSASATPLALSDSSSQAVHSPAENGNARASPTQDSASLRPCSLARKIRPEYARSVSKQETLSRNSSGSHSAASEESASALFPEDGGKNRLCLMQGFVIFPLRHR